MTTTTTAAKAPAKRGRRPVPAPDTTSTSTTGLDALTTGAPTTAPSSLVALDLVHPHPDNPRRDLGDLTELTDSIRAHGVRQNLLLVPDPDQPGEYRTVIGHRRTAAARLAGLTHLPAVVDDTLTPAEQLELMLLENIQRTDLTPVEEADGYQGLLDLGVDVAQISARTGRSETTVRSRLRLAMMPGPARAAVHEHRATLEDAAALTDFDDDPDTQAALADVIGTDDFAYQLAAAQRRRTRRKAMEPLLKLLRAANAVELADVDKDGVPAGLGRALAYDPDVRMPSTHGTSWVTLERATEILEEVAAGWAWAIRGFSGDLYVYRPQNLEEVATEEARPAPVDPPWLVAQRERDAEREAARERFAELADATQTTREDFVRGLLARKQLTQAEQRELLAFTGFEMLLGAWLDDPDTFAPSWQHDDPDRLERWLGVDRDAILAQAADDEVDPEDAVDQAVRTAIADTPPAHRLLLGLVLANEPVTWQGWWRPYRGLRAWYALLESLGYVVSDAERTALEPESPEP